MVGFNDNSKIWKDICKFSKKNCERRNEGGWICFDGSTFCQNYCKTCERELNRLEALTHKSQEKSQ